MSAISAHRRRRDAIHRASRRVSAGGWKADLLHLAGSIALIVAVVVLRLWWARHQG